MSEVRTEHTIEIQGHAFVIRSGEQPDRIKAIERVVNERLDALDDTSQAPLQSLLLLATLNLAEELLEERDSHARLKEKIRSGSRSLLQKLEASRFAA